MAFLGILQKSRFWYVNEGKVCFLSFGDFYMRGDLKLLLRAAKFSFEPLF